MSLAYEYDETLDILTIEGIRYSGEFFRTLGKDGAPLGTVVEISQRREGGIVELTRVFEANVRDGKIPPRPHRTLGFLRI